MSWNVWQESEHMSPWKQKTYESGPKQMKADFESRVVLKLRSGSCLDQPFQDLQHRQGDYAWCIGLCDPVAVFVSFLKHSQSLPPESSMETEITMESDRLNWTCVFRQTPCSRWESETPWMAPNVLCTVRGLGPNWEKKQVFERLSRDFESYNLHLLIDCCWLT